jgi:hypothetical protein
VDQHTEALWPSTSLPRGAGGTKRHRERTGSAITASGGGGFGAGSSAVSGASDAELRHLTVENTVSPRLSNVTATAAGAESNQGVVNAGSSPTMTDVSATAEGGYKANVGASKLDGGTVSVVGTGSAVKCAGVHDENYTFSAGPTCP